MSFNNYPHKALAYINNNEVEQDDNDQFAPEEAASDDQLGEMLHKILRERNE